MSETNLYQQLFQQVQGGSDKALARLISMLENGVEGYESFLQSLTGSDLTIIGITGSPGAGKSTITDALIDKLKQGGKRIGVICVDPSSPFSKGAVLGDRVRMNRWFNDPHVFIRSLATRGALGGLNPRIMEIIELMKASGFDYIIVETVGVGQSEVEIASLADTTIVIFVPEAGDEIQTMKSGLMEIADLFVVNKADRPGADRFVSNLKYIIHSRQDAVEIPVVKTIATEGVGIDELLEKILAHSNTLSPGAKKWELLAARAYYIIQEKRMKGLTRKTLAEKISDAAKGRSFNLYRFIDDLEKNLATE